MEENREDTQDMSSSGDADNEVRNFTFVKVSNRATAATSIATTNTCDADDYVYSDFTSAVQLNATSCSTAKICKRFGQATEENINAIKERRYEYKTARSTIWGTNIFKE